MAGEGLLKQLISITDILHAQGHTKEAEALSNVSDLTLLASDFGGLGYSSDVELSSQQEAEVVFLVSAWLEALNSADRIKSPPKALSSRPEGRRGMTLSEKIFAAHDIDRKGEVKPGDMVRVSVDWVMASDLTWNVGLVKYMQGDNLQKLTVIGHGTNVWFSRKARYLPK